MSISPNFPNVHGATARLMQYPRASRGSGTPTRPGRILRTRRSHRQIAIAKRVSLHVAISSSRDRHQSRLFMPAVVFCGKWIWALKKALRAPLWRRNAFFVGRGKLLPGPTNVFLSTPCGPRSVLLQHSPQNGDTPQSKWLAVLWLWRKKANADKCGRYRLTLTTSLAYPSKKVAVDSTWWFKPYPLGSSQ